MPTLMCRLRSISTNPMFCQRRQEHDVAVPLCTSDTVSDSWDSSRLGHPPVTLCSSAPLQEHPAEGMFKVSQGIGAQDVSASSFIRVVTRHVQRRFADARRRTRGRTPCHESGTLPTVTTFSCSCTCVKRQHAPDRNYTCYSHPPSKSS